MKVARVSRILPFVIGTAWIGGGVATIIQGAPIFATVFLLTGGIICLWMAVSPPVAISVDDETICIRGGFKFY